MRLHMTYIRIVVWLVLLFFSIHLNAQENSINDKVALSYLGYNAFNTLPDSTIAYDLDSILFNCLGTSGATTVGSIDCYNALTDTAKKMINQEYKKLYTKLEKDDKKLLEETQDRWNKYFTREKDFLYSTFYTWTNYAKYGHGREHSIAQAEWVFQIARQRLIAIRAFRMEVDN
ncbi:MAG: DUF1311 domain-containing protein [Taibaiella sp.]|nr:DUF1311 domain-containing protein [Taibaiella sp.]